VKGSLNLRERGTRRLNFGLAGSAQQYLAAVLDLGRDDLPGDKAGVVRIGERQRCAACSYDSQCCSEC
jgi:hypothetical protein